MYSKIVLAVFTIFLCESGVDSQVADDVRIRFYTGPSQWQLYDVTNVHTAFSHSAFDNARDTVFYHYGFSQTENSDNVVEVINAYTTAGHSNFFLIYYLSVATNVITNAREIGDALAGSYVRICDAGVPAERLHLVGFSLGAQIQAIASRTVQQSTNRRLVVGRLTGIDPGQIQAVLIPLIGRLSANDAAFVDSIHTEGVGFGDHQSIGHVSYMVNGGVAQPFCSSIINTIAQTCSHNFAPTAWAESVRSSVPIFPSLPCVSWNYFVAGDCNVAPAAHMGMHTTVAARGAHFLRTNHAAPFSRPVATP